MAVDRQLATEQVMRQSRRGMRCHAGDKARGVVEQWAVARQSQLQGWVAKGRASTAGPSEKNLRNCENNGFLGPAPEHRIFWVELGSSVFSQASQGMDEARGLERTSPGLFQAGKTPWGPAPFWVPLGSPYAHAFRIGTTPWFVRPLTPGSTPSQKSGQTLASARFLCGRVP